MRKPFAVVAIVPVHVRVRRLQLNIAHSYHTEVLPLHDSLDRRRKIIGIIHIQSHHILDLILHVHGDRQVATCHSFVHSQLQCI